MRMKYSLEEVLCFSVKPKAKATVKRYYAIWRKKKGVPIRCDNPVCSFHTKKLEWNEKDLPLILDHENGNNKDNRIENLRYLCPNCDAQLPTKGGRNIGRVTHLSEGGYRLKHFSGKTSQVIIGKGETITTNSGSGKITHNKALNN